MVNLSKPELMSVLFGGLISGAKPNKYNMRRYFLLLFLFVSLTLSSYAQKVISLYNGKAPGSESWTWKETESMSNAFSTPLVYNVSDPTITVYPADPQIANGTAIVVCPGGAFQFLSISNEGTQVVKWLNSKGITAFIVKYRLIHTVSTDPVAEVMTMMQNRDDFEKLTDPIITMAIQDGKKAMEYVRAHAAEYNINPKRIGLMGFSAGGTVTMGVGTSYTPEQRPDFLAPIYLYRDPKRNMGVPKDAPPIFICAASDDQLSLAPHSVALYNDWIAANKPAELHMFSKGGHGFGMRKQNLPSDKWIERFGDWLELQGFLKR